MMRKTLLAIAALGLSACSGLSGCAGLTIPSDKLTDPLPKAIYVDPASAGWNVTALDEVARYAASQKTTGLLIIDNGRIVYEHNWPLGDDARTFRTNFVHGADSDGALLEDIASGQKSYIAVLAGIAIDKKLLDISKPVSDYIKTGWSKAPAETEAKITVRNLLEMTSGLKEDFTSEAEPGTKFFYNTPAYAILKPVLEAASGQSLDAITADWMTKPLEMADTSWRKRPAAFADVGNPTGLVTSPRDLARLGQLILDGGKSPTGQRVISKAQLDLMLAPTATNPAYGRLWWLNGGAYSLAAGPNIARTEGPLIATAPMDLVAAQGAQDRKLYVVPSRKLIVVRMGQAADRDFNQQLWARLTSAIPGK
jgi:CubicO group peptidase (beta-lactamase class C family)